MSTLTYVRDNKSGELVYQSNKSKISKSTFTPNHPSILTSNKKANFKAYSYVPIPLVLGTVSNVSGAGVFWDTFMDYIFPWMLDIAKVYCLIRIAQAFYQERRGGRDEKTGFSAMLEHGKWYLIFWLLPLGVELIDQIGNKMFNDMHSKNLIPSSSNP